MIRIAICTDGIFPESVGGMQKHSRMLIEELSNYIDLEIFVLHPHSKVIFNEKVREIHIEPIDEKKNYLIECYRYSKRIYKVLEQLDPHLVYSQGLSVWHNASKFKGKLIVNPHGLEAYQGITLKDKIMGTPFRFIFNRLFRHATVTISLGGKLTEIIRKRTSRVQEIPNATNTHSNINPISRDDKINVLFVARLVYNKGIDVLFSAIRKLDENGLLGSYKFTLVGKGPYFKSVVRRNKYQNVDILGFVHEKDMSGLFNSHDVFVLPTLFEGMPTVILEAMSYSLPVVVSDVGATSVLVDDGNGRLITAGSVDELYESLVWFRSLTSQQRTHLGRKSLDKFKAHFTWPVVARQHHELFLRMSEFNGLNAKM